jgi:hypothetical protein
MAGFIISQTGTAIGSIFFIGLKAFRDASSLF